MKLHLNIHRYSHTTALVDNDLYLIGGVSLTSTLPIVTGLNLMTGICFNYILEVKNHLYLVFFLTFHL